MTVKLWNPRYLAYCYPRTPEVQLRLDDEQYRGGKMIGFMLWISARWREFDELKGRHGDDPDARGNHSMREFDEWLLGRADLATWPNSNV